MNDIYDYIGGLCVICFIAGAFLGVLFLILKIVKLALKIRKIGEAALDILFWAISAVLVFLIAFAASEGILRFVEAAFILIGFFSVLLVFDPLVSLISNKVNIILNKLFRFIKGKFKRRKKPNKKNTRQKKLNKGKNSQKFQKKPKKT